MGWWSTTVMGGDTPLDFRGEMLADVCNLKESFWDEYDCDVGHPTVAEVIESHMHDLIEYAWSIPIEQDRDIAFQVLGYLILESGIQVSPVVVRALNLAMTEGCDKDSWAAEGDRERIEYIAEFRQQLQEYCGETVEVASESLSEPFRRLSEDA